MKIPEIEIIGPVPNKFIESMRDVFKNRMLVDCDVLQAFIEARERKAWEASAKDCKAYFEKEGIVMTVQGNFDEYKNSEEYNE